MESDEEIDYLLLPKKKKAVAKRGLYSCQKCRKVDFSHTKASHELADVLKGVALSAQGKFSLSRGIPPAPTCPTCQGTWAHMGDFLQRKRLV